VAFSIHFSPRAGENVRKLRKRDQQIIVDAISVQLTANPDQQTRNRKKLQANPLAPWELRVGQFRVFYDIDADSDEVVIVAIGRKTHNVLRIGDEEIEL